MSDKKYGTLKYQLFRIDQGALEGHRSCAQTARRGLGDPGFRLCGLPFFRIAAYCADAAVFAPSMVL